MSEMIQPTAPLQIQYFGDTNEQEWLELLPMQPCSSLNSIKDKQIEHLNEFDLGPQSPPVAVPQPMGPSSTQTVCTVCGNYIYTSTSKKAKSSAWWSCILMCFCGCFCGCCLIPCCMDSCNVVNHKCPKCDSFLGQYRP